MKKFTYLLPMIVIISFVFLGCAKDDDEESTTSSTTTTTTSTAVTAETGTAAITLSAKISVVDAKSSASTARVGGRTWGRTANAIDTTAFASTVDYNVDETGTFVYERSSEALNTVNEILCQIGQARGDLMINEGNYKAQIDVSKCKESSGDSKSGAPDYEMWILNVSRASGEPMKVKGWVPMGDGLIYFMGDWYQSPSDTYPLGHFSFHFEQREGATTSGDRGMYGYMKALKSGDTTTLQFYMNQDSAMYGMTAGTEILQSVTATFNADDSGSGATNLPYFTQSGYAGQKTYDLAFNDDYFYKQKKVGVTSSSEGTASTAVCLDRNKYIKSAWRYGLYDSAGARKTISSGFPITDSTGAYNGYIGYYGLWMPSDAGVDNGSTVKKLDFDNPDSAGVSYTVLSYGGKLRKYQKQSITLGSIKNIPFEWFDMSSYAAKRVYWDGSNFKVDGQRVRGYWVDNTTSTLTLTASNVPYGFFFYSRALGGDGQIQLAYPSGRGTAPTAPADNATVIFNTQTPIFPGDSVPSTLACYSNCPNPSTIATGEDYQGATTSVYLPSKWNWGTDIDNYSTPNPYTYTFDNTTSGMVLKYDNGSGSQSIILSSANSNLPWGFRSGILFDNSTFDNDTSARQADYAALTCNWNSNYLCPWQARGGLSTFYIWQTGTDDWQKLTVLVDSDNTSVTFDPPMIVKYTHSGTSSNSGKNYNDSSFYLEYGGFGDLWGIPSYCVSTSTGEKVDCAASSQGTTRWVNEFVIPATSIATLAGGTTEYVVKPLEIEQTMPEASGEASDCTGAGLSLGGVSLPSASDFVSPVSDVGTKPTVTGPPTIVSGEKKGS